MAGIIVLFLISAAVVHAIGVGAVTVSGRPTAKRVWVVFFIMIVFVASPLLLMAVAVNASGTQSCSGDCGLVGMASGVYTFFFIAGGFIGTITMAIHGAIKVHQFNQRFGVVRNTSPKR